MKNVTCPYCGKQSRYVDSAVVYGRSYGMIYYCKPCDAYVGVHKGTDQPLGRLADAQLRYWKKRAHAFFDPIWQSGRFIGRRKAAYEWLAEQLGLHPSKTHIGMFDVPLCKRVVDIMEKERSKTP